MSCNKWPLDDGFMKLRDVGPFGENIQNTAVKFHVTLAPLARNIQYKAMIPPAAWTPCVPSTVGSYVY
jgi:hypothetical protein